MDYGSSSYWDERYALTSPPFDWLLPYPLLKPHLLPYLSPSPSFEILIPGCGTSTLGAEIYDDGYVNITNVDQSNVSTMLMKTIHYDRNEMEYTHGNCTDMTFIPDGVFDLIIDKGLMDCVLCQFDNIQSFAKMGSEMFRVLKPDTGVYVIISHGKPEMRLQHLEGLKGADGKRLWEVDVKVLPKEGGGGEGIYMYVCRKI